MQTTNTKSTTNNYTIFITTNHPSFQKCYMYFSPLVKPNKAEVRARFLHIDTWISQSCCMEYSKLLHGFVKIDTCISSPLSNQTKQKFHQDFSIYNDRRVCVMWSPSWGYKFWGAFFFKLLIWSKQSVTGSVVPLAMFYQLHNISFWPRQQRCISAR